ncbi:hypothetical protein V8F33_012685 [Rhypophila sp. PSN 637]
MSKDNLKGLGQDQPGLEVVPPTIDKTAPEANYVENEASPPPQEVQVNSMQSPFRPSSHYGIMPNYADPFSGYSKEVDAGMNPGLLDTTSPYTTTTINKTVYSPTARDLEDNRRPPILSAGAGDEQMIKEGPFWRKKKFWIIVGSVAGVILVIGAIVGGVLASQGD